MSKSINSVRIFTGRTFLNVDDNIYETEMFSQNKKLKKGCGYIKGDYVYIYHGRLSKHKNDIELKPGIYLDDTKENREYIFIEYKKEEKNKYSVNSLIELDVDNIFNELKASQEKFPTIGDIEMINNNSEIYRPIFSDDDDFLKYIVKRVIQSKKINFKNYKSKFSNPYTMNNLVSSLKNKTKMSVPNFRTWEDILGFKWEMRIYDAGTDPLNPMDEEFTITSDDL